MPEEKKPFHTQSCGLNIGVMNLPAPLVHIHLYDDELHIHYPIDGNVWLTYAEITAARLEKQWLFHGVKIEHTNRNVNANVFVWAGNAEELHALIAAKLPQVAAKD